MMEEFRPVIVDFTCWRLLPELGPQQDWFSVDGNGLLSEHARKLLIQALERRFSAHVRHAPTRTRVTLRRAIELQVLAFGAVLENRRRRFAPLK